MKEYKLKRHIPDIVPPKNLEEVIERVVTIEEIINELKEIHNGRGKEGNEKEIDV